MEGMHSACAASIGLSQKSCLTGSRFSLYLAYAVPIRQVTVAVRRCGVAKRLVIAPLRLLRLLLSDHAIVPGNATIVCSAVLHGLQFFEIGGQALNSNNHTCGHITVMRSCFAIVVIQLLQGPCKFAAFARSFLSGLFRIGAF